jgi:hypothetical protein
VHACGGRRRTRTARTTARAIFDEAFSIITNMGASFYMVGEYYVFITAVPIFTVKSPRIKM